MCWTLCSASILVTREVESGQVKTMGFWRLPPPALRSCEHLLAGRPGGWGSLGDKFSLKVAA